jgi:hypothetical protein
MEETMTVRIAVLVAALAGWQAAAPSPAALTADGKGWVDLLADKTMKSWTRVAMTPAGQLPAGDLSQPSPWTVDAAGLLVCDGNTVGHEMFRYGQEVGDFVLHAEWRVAPELADKPYNSGVFARTSADASIWHQAQTGTGGGYLFGRTLVAGQPGRLNLRDQMIENRVKPAGEWNVYEIRAAGKTLSLWVNGAVVSEFKECEVPRGYVGLESEGYHIEFRNVKLKVLP